MAAPDFWIAPTGVRLVNPEAVSTTVPVQLMVDAGFSLTSIGLYGELLSYQGVPMNPYQNSIDELEDIRAAIDELVSSGYVVRVPPPLD